MDVGSNHFLSLPRPDIFLGPPAGVPDTTTLAAHDFDVDTRTGFMPPQPPLSRLLPQWESWESILDEAKHLQLKLGDTPGLSEHEQVKSDTWRKHVRELPVLDIAELTKSEVQLRRAHHVLGWILHFYVQSLPPDAPVIIPSPISLPALRISAHLQLPPVLTYSDDVLYNWELKTPLPSPDSAPALTNLRCQTLFTGTTDEEEFYLTSARIELKGVDALEIMQIIMDEAFVGDDIAIRRITQYLLSLSTVIRELRGLLLAVRESCDPDVFYHYVRPWFRGMDSDPKKRRWVFEGLEQDESLLPPLELSGPSAGQSSLIHALDIFLGVDQYSHGDEMTGSSSGSSGSGSGAPSSSEHETDVTTATPTDNAITSNQLRKNKKSKTGSAFLDRMQLYMPRHHRNFLNHLSANPRPLRAIVKGSGDAGLLEAYNTAVSALKEFRDAHMIVVALYIIGPSKRPAPNAPDSTAFLRPDVKKDYGTGTESLKGTGGTELVRFLKDVRERTAAALLPPIST